MTLSARAAANLQHRLYAVTREALGSALEISAEAGPADRLDEVLILIEDAAAAVRSAQAAVRNTDDPLLRRTGHSARPER